MTSANGQFCLRRFVLDAWRNQPSALKAVTLLLWSGAMVQIGFVLFPNVTQLDFTGPLQVLHRLPDSQVHIISHTLEPVPSDCGLSLVPNMTFENCPQLDLTCVPGGFGVEQAMVDPVLIGFLKQQAKTARYITSVCTGAFVLGAAGLLKGKKATTHWAYHALLSDVGAIPTQGRVVRDGSIFTGGGVTAGIDFALTIVAELASQAIAQSIQLAIEYDPAPPFVGGSPQTAPEPILERISSFYAKRNLEFGPAVVQAFERFGA